MARPTPSLTRQRALNLIRKNRPTSLEQFSELGLIGRFVGSGIFREVYKVKNSGLIVKFPLAEGKTKPYDHSSGIRHSATEARRISRLRAALPELIPHLPEVLYHDRAHGILVMRYYPPVYVGDRFEMLGKVVRKLVRKHGRVKMSDIHSGNIRAGVAKKSIVFVDLGY